MSVNSQTETQAVLSVLNAAGTVIPFIGDVMITEAYQNRLFLVKSKGTVIASFCCSANDFPIRFHLP
jgi:hypothetical protein